MIGRRIKELRTENGLTQQELAKILNVSSMSISFYENEQRKPDSEFIIACSRFFDVSTDYLLGKTYKRRIPREERFVAYSYGAEKLYADYYYIMRLPNTIHFATKEKAEEAIEVFRDELIWYFVEYQQRLDEE